MVKPPAVTIVATAVDSFDSFVRANWEGLHRFAFLVAGNDQDAQDAVQDALTGLCSHWTRVSQRGDPGAYLRRSIVNAHVSRWRRRRGDVPADLASAASAVPDPADRLAEQDRLIRLCRDLPARQRAALVLRIYEDASYEQIAQVCGGNEAAARSLVRHALLALRSRIAQDDTDGRQAPVNTEHEGRHSRIAQDAPDGRQTPGARVDAGDPHLAVLKEEEWLEEEK